MPPLKIEIATEIMSREKIPISLLYTEICFSLLSPMKVMSRIRTARKQSGAENGFLD